MPATKFLLIALTSLLTHPAYTATKPANTPEQTSVVPFIGCPADGQVGPLGPPKGKPPTVHIPKEQADKLAYYKAEQGSGVLAPRGWYCVETYGSNGSSLFVSPLPIDSKNLFSDTWKGFTSPVIQITDLVGDTSGRFGVARIIARVFPAHKAFVRKVIAEGIEPASDFPSGPFPADKLTYKSKELVEYETPAHAEGLGTASWLLATDTPIRGVAILTGPEPSLVHLSVRLPQKDADLTTAIIHQTEYEAAHPPRQ